MQDNSVIHVTTDISPTNIGANVTIGHGAIIHGCTIEHNCLIGMGSIGQRHLQNYIHLRPNYNEILSYRTHNN